MSVHVYTGGWWVGGEGKGGEGGKAIVGYPKMYNSLKVDGFNKCKVMGVKKCIMKKHLHHEIYKATFFEIMTFHHGMNKLWSQGHHIYGMHVKMILLLPSCGL